MTLALSTVLYGAAALACLVVAIGIAVMLRSRAAILPAVVCVTTALWAAAVAFAPDRGLNGWPAMVEVARSATWLLLLLSLGRMVSGGVLPRIARRSLWIGIVLALVAQVALLASVIPLVDPAVAGLPAMLARLALGLLIVLTAENLFRNADAAARWHVNLPCIVLGGLSTLDILVYAEASLSSGTATPLFDARAVLIVLTVPLLGMAALRARRWRRRATVSREVAFHGATLVVAGTFLLAAGVAGEALRRTGTDWGQAAQASLLAGAVMAVLVAATSRSARSRLRRLAVDHFFAARFDYRREWLRCIATLSETDDAEPAATRAIRAIADAVDSPRGVLFKREPGTAGLRWAGSWNLPDEPLALAAEDELLASLRDGSWVRVFGDDTPAALSEAFGPLWLAVPLHHHRDGLLGVVMLSRPRAPFALDREVFDLLRMLGREVALFLAERRAAERLADQRRLEDYAKRFAFVAHDVKNVSNQLTLVLANAERNIQDPEFQHDMLFTLRRSAERINTLIARLRRPDQDAPAPAGVCIAAVARLRALARARAHKVSVDVEGPPPGLAAIDPDRFDAAVIHLLDNAVDASASDEPVHIRVRAEDERVVIDISDRGPGMTAEFIRDELFRPLSTSKLAGSGIGAWQARDILRTAGGDITVLSRPGAGTTMRITLPALNPTASQPGEPVKLRARTAEEQSA